MAEQLDVPAAVALSNYAGVLKAEGVFVAGRKSGPWRFFTAAGALDPERSGTYESDHRVAPLLRD